MKSNKERAVTQSVVGGQRPWNLERITARTPLPAVMSAVSGPGQQKLSTTATERHGNGNSNQSPNPWALERIEQMERIGGRRREHMVVQGGSWTCNVAAQSSSAAHAPQPRDSAPRAPVATGLASCPGPKRILISQRCRFCWRKSRKMRPGFHEWGVAVGVSGDNLTEGWMSGAFVEQNITHPRLQLEIQSSPFNATRIVHKILSRYDCNSFRKGLAPIT